MRKSTTIHLIGVFAVIACFMSSMAFAQSTTDGAIGGTITDQTGAVVAGAAVTVKNIDTNITSKTTSDSNGRYRVISLKPGTYLLETTAGNFTPSKKTNIVVEVGLVSNVDVVLGVTAAGETAEVTSEAPVVNTQQQDFASNINQTQINELPINGRRRSQFALMTPGANPDGNFGLVSFRGISGLLNNNTIDGGDNNNAFYGEERGRTRIGYVISQAAIQEFQVNTSNFSAEYGRAAGGVVNAVTKSGSNALHGSLFWYYRNEELNAFNPFTFRPTLVGSTVTNVPIKPEDRRHQFGGTVGGPIIKDKLFFFYSHDQQKREFPGVAAPGSPTFFNPFSASELSTFTTRGITPAEQQAGLDYLLSLTGDVSRSGNQTLHLPKIDWKINDNHSLALSYNRLRWYSEGGIQTAPVVSRGRTSWGNDGVKTDVIIARLNSAFSPMVSNEFRFHYGRDYLFGTPQTPAANEVVTSLGLPVGASIASTSGMIIGTSDYIPRPQNPQEGRYQFADTISWARGQHLIKAGFDLNRVTDTVDSLFNAFGTYTYNNRVDFISDFTNISRPTLNSRRYTSFTQGIGTPGVEFSTTDIAFFIQDDWRVLPTLTLNLGFRYEYQMMPGSQIPNPLIPGTETLPSDNNNFGPRFGFAWDVFGDSKTALRGGFGIYYGRFLNSTISSALLQTVTGDAQRQFTMTTSSVGAPLYPNLPAPGTPLPSDAVVYAHDAESPQIYQFDMILEHQISKNTSISASYLYSKGTKLPGFVDTNLPETRVPITYHVNGGDFSGMQFTVDRYNGTRPNPAAARIINVTDFVGSEYNAGVLQFNRRLTNGLQFQTSYTFSRADDNGQGSTTFTTTSNVLDPNNLLLEEGRSNLHTRHKWGANAVWQPDWFKNHSNAAVRYLLSGYSIAPIVAISSGRPFTGTLSGNAPGCPSGFTGVLCAGGTNRLPTIARNAYTFPMFFNTDLRLSKRIPVREGMSLELLAEAFNLTNHVNIASMNTRQYTIGSTVSGIVQLNADPTFNTPNGSAGTLSRERQMQFAVRFAF